MAFLLTIAEGKESGREFTFDQPQVVIGRNAECDVVLYDPGVSRKHARIFHEGESYFVEDMGSSNGTKVNGTLVKRQELADGDAVTLGPVVFKFGAAAEDPIEKTTAASVVDESTRIVQRSSVRPPPARRPVAALAPEGVAGDRLEALGRSNTRSIEGASRPRLPATRRASQESSALPARPSRPSQSAMRGGLSAADRARIKRESHPLVAQAKIFWSEADDRVRLGLGVGAGVVGVALLGLIIFWVLGSARGPTQGPEPTYLARQVIEASFGLGEEVDYTRVDEKAFEFDVNVALSPLALLHFQAKEISQGEVAILVNGKEVGLVPADGLDSTDRFHDVVIHSKFLKKGETNVLVFDNTKNPPGKDPWRVWNLWMETILLPKMAPEKILEEAQADYGRARKKLETPDIGAENRYQAWKDFRKAWLMLEALDEPRPELYGLAREGMREARKLLDDKCRDLLRDANAAYGRGDYRLAKSTLEHVNKYFPNYDHPCKRRAEYMLEEYQL
jgi:pSer/pThr/pTyr-binding forkhead associated (FHA) protein